MELKNRSIEPDAPASSATLSSAKPHPQCDDHQISKRFRANFAGDEQPLFGRHPKSRSSPVVRSQQAHTIHVLGKLISYSATGQATPAARSRTTRRGTGGYAHIARSPPSNPFVFAEHPRFAQRVQGALRSHPRPLPRLASTSDWKRLYYKGEEEQNWCNLLFSIW